MIIEQAVHLKQRNLEIFLRNRLLYVNGGFRFLKNITGFWIIQECKKFWDENIKSYSYDELTEMALKYGHANFRINPDDPRFLKLGLIDNNMPDRIKSYCRETGQKVPETPAEITRGIIESFGLPPIIRTIS